VGLAHHVAGEARAGGDCFPGDIIELEISRPTKLDIVEAIAALRVFRAWAERLLEKIRAGGDPSRHAVKAKLSAIRLKLGAAPRVAPTRYGACRGHELRERARTLRPRDSARDREVGAAPTNDEASTAT
jgi:hypothetical protein